MKRIIVHMDNRTEQHLLSGSIYHVDRRLERQGGNIFLERNYVQHDTIRGIRSIMLPKLHLWVIFFEGQNAPCPCRCYMHVARILDGGEQITVEDLYLDILVDQQGHWQLVDIDEFRAAIASGELSPEQTLIGLEGLENACRLVDGARGDVETYLRRWLAQSRAGA